MKVGNVILYENERWEVTAIYLEDSFNTSVISVVKLHPSEIREARVKLKKLNVISGSQSVDIPLSKVWTPDQKPVLPAFWNPDDLVPSKLK